MSTLGAGRTIGIARELAKDITEWRRYLHAHPETGAETPETAAYVAAVLRDLGLEVRTGVADTGWLEFSEALLTTARVTLAPSLLERTWTR
jgi:hypothetical protein